MFPTLISLGVNCPTAPPDMTSLNFRAQAFDSTHPPAVGANLTYTCNPGTYFNTNRSLTSLKVSLSSLKNTFLFVFYSQAKNLSFCPWQAFLAFYHIYIEPCTVCRTRALFRNIRLIRREFLSRLN